MGLFFLISLYEAMMGVVLKFGEPLVHRLGGGTGEEYGEGRNSVGGGIHSMRQRVICIHQ